MSAEEAVVELAQATANAVGEVLGGFGVSVDLGVARIIDRESDPLEALPLPAVVSSVSYVGGVSGGNVLALTSAGARRLATAMGAGEDTGAGGQLNPLALSAVSEAANQMLAAAAAATAAVLGREVDVAPPSTHQMSEAGGPVESEQAAYVTSVTLTVDDEEGRLVQLVPQAFVLRMEAALEGRHTEPPAGAAGGADADALSSTWLLDTRLRLDVELGRTRLGADDILTLGDGAIVTLDRLATDPIDLRVNGVPFASGRLLLDDGQWAIRIDTLFENDLNQANG
jgi:flagellar motor switch protein FliN/FliY